MRQRIYVFSTEIVLSQTSGSWAVVPEHADLAIQHRMYCRSYAFLFVRHVRTILMPNGRKAVATGF